MSPCFGPMTALFWLVAEVLEFDELTGPDIFNIRRLGRVSFHHPHGFPTLRHLPDFFHLGVDM